ncbi:hypothetical protein CLV51_104253 [Chitinophaga niastensis]|uniref:Uncharacterized protein n=1 Tax=Chitinophaga niastensis TaxID=536980 RepID=A0A2P8HH50_CHINA|nr:hypothetical protein [Chitinophaga niastensis]PSL45548.1 hypothetical protein CLV51_104253 [Chitinophaga niastensis]
MNLKQNLVALAFISLAAVSCKTTQSSAGCKFEGVVKDMSGLDGCGLLIELKDGTRLQPVEFAHPGFTLKAGQAVKLNYTELKDRMSTCMGGKMARIDCITAIK